MTDDLAARLEDQDLRNVLATQDGRRFLYRVIDQIAGFGREVFGGQTVPEFEATHRAAYLDGRRSIALDLVAECQRVDAPNYVRMLEEALDRRRLAEEAARKAQEIEHGGPG